MEEYLLKAAGHSTHRLGRMGVAHSREAATLTCISAGLKPPVIPRAILGIWRSHIREAATKDTISRSLKPPHSSICLPKNAAATCASRTSPSVGMVPLSGWMRHTAPVTSPPARMGLATAA